ncbi:MAG: hypothetical protein IJ685_03425 [Selenomonadaceae bacterium]|nr:hypothetical protein [Selenomonadaceae bacterium]
MNLEKFSLDDKERDSCIDAGKTLAQVCLDGFDDNKKFLDTLARLSPQTRRILLNQIILYKIFFVFAVCRRRLDDAHAKCLLDSMSDNLRGRLSPTTFGRFKNKLRIGTEFPCDKFTVRQLAQQAGFSLEELTESEWERLQETFAAEFEALNFLVDGMIKILNIPPSERKNFTLTVPVKKSAQPVRNTPVNRPAQPAPNNNSWKWLLVILVILGFAAFNYNEAHDTSPNKNRPAQNVSESVKKPEPVASRPTEKPKPKHIERIAKIGVMTGYDYDQPILNDDGLCEFTIDNTRNDMPVYVRIWDVDTHLPVRAFTIDKGDKFTARNLSPGTYEVRYKELYENDVPPYGSKSEPTTLEQHETYSGTSYSIVELTLYKVHNGNTTTTRIDADDV